jgi:hypothetical protein
MFSLVIVYKPDLCMFTEAAACSAVDMVTAGVAPALVRQDGAERRATAAQVQIVSAPSIAGHQLGKIFQL